MARPNPKTYPFNYLVHAGDAHQEFVTYPEAADYVSQTYPTAVMEEHWSCDAESRFKSLPWSEFDDPHKYAWTSLECAEQFAKLDSLLLANETDAAQQYLSGELGVALDSGTFEPLEQLAAFIFANCVCAIERRRDAYEAAMQEFNASQDDGAQQDGAQQGESQQDESPQDDPPQD